MANTQVIISMEQLKENLNLTQSALIKVIDYFASDGRHEDLIEHVNCITRCKPEDKDVDELIFSALDLLSPEYIDTEVGKEDYKNGN